MINVYEILKQLPKDTEVYCAVFGDNCGVELSNYENDDFPIRITYSKYPHLLNKFGQEVLDIPNAECMIFPAKDHRTWENWKEYYRSKKKLELLSDLKPDEIVLVRNNELCNWVLSHFGFISKTSKMKPFVCTNGESWRQCIPYKGNERLLGTTDIPE